MNKIIIRICVLKHQIYQNHQSLERKTEISVKCNNIEKVNSYILITCKTRGIQQISYQTNFIKYNINMNIIVGIFCAIMNNDFYILSQF